LGALRRGRRSKALLARTRKTKGGEGVMTVTRPIAPVLGKRGGNVNVDGLKGARGK